MNFFYSTFYFTLLDECSTKQFNEYKVKLQKADQEIATLQATVKITGSVFVVFFINQFIFSYIGLRWLD